MRPFTCTNCGNRLFFENGRCESCGASLGFLPAETAVITLAPGPEPDLWARADGAPGLYRFCANAAHDVCNWLVEDGSEEPFCACCRTNLTVPDLTVEGNAERWRRIEVAKHRLAYSLIRWNLPIVTRAEEPETGLAFEFLADAPDEPVMTGHDNGLITLNIAEADDALREKARAEMGEPYRTLLGHFRHEIGHYYWDRLVSDGGRLAACRAVFGDDSMDYGEALDRHYEEGAPPDWEERFVSAYATMHPWEDFAETWAHYFHIVDTLETAAAFRMVVAGAQPEEGDRRMDFDPYTPGPFANVVDAWLPLTFAVNALNRSMGLPDLYPFVLAPAAIDKLDFIHRLVHGEVPADPPEEEGDPDDGEADGDEPDGDADAGAV